MYVWHLAFTQNLCTGAQHVFIHLPWKTKPPLFKIIKDSFHLFRHRCSQLLLNIFNPWLRLWGIGLRGGGFSVQARLQTKHARCSDSKGTQDTFRSPARYPWARYPRCDLQRDITVKKRWAKIYRTFYKNYILSQDKSVNSIFLPRWCGV